MRGRSREEWADWWGRTGGGVTANRGRGATTPTPAGAPKKRGKRGPSLLEERLAEFVTRAGLPAPVRELRFARPRMWRFDFAWPAVSVAVEVEGGVFIHGGHSRGVDMTDDCEKYNVAAILGWTVLRFTVKQFERGEVFQVVEAVLAGDRAKYRHMLTAIVGTADSQTLLGAGRWQPPTEETPAHHTQRTT